VESEEVVRIWRAEDRYRQQLEGGQRDGSLSGSRREALVDWDRVSGLAATRMTRSMGLGVGGEELRSCLTRPAARAAAIRVTGRAVIAGRAAIVAEAIASTGSISRPRAVVSAAFARQRAERYELSVDEQLGVLLRVVALRDDDRPRGSRRSRSPSTSRSLRSTSRSEPPAGETIHQAGSASVPSKSR